MPFDGLKRHFERQHICLLTLRIPFARALSSPPSAALPSLYQLHDTSSSGIFWTIPSFVHFSVCRWYYDPDDLWVRNIVIPSAQTFVKRIKWFHSIDACESSWHRMQTKRTERRRRDEGENGTSDFDCYCGLAINFARRNIIIFAFNSSSSSH